MPGSLPKGHEYILFPEKFYINSDLESTQWNCTTFWNHLLSRPTIGLILPNESGSAILPVCLRSIYLMHGYFLRFGTFSSLFVPHNQKRLCRNHKLRNQDKLAVVNLPNYNESLIEPLTGRFWQSSLFCSHTPKLLFINSLDLDTKTTSQECKAIVLSCWQWMAPRQVKEPDQVNNSVFQAEIHTIVTFSVEKSSYHIAKRP